MFDTLQIPEHDEFFELRERLKAEGKTREEIAAIQAYEEYVDDFGICGVEDSDNIWEEIRRREQELLQNPTAPL